LLPESRLRNLLVGQGATPVPPLGLLY